MRSARSLAALLALIALTFAPMPVLAQAAKAPAQVNRATLERAAFNFRLLASAMQSDKIPPQVKDALFSCIYSNSLSKIGEAMEKVIAVNGNKINRTNPDQMIGVMAGVCGFRPQAPAPAPKR